jgi:hypothetical protein
MLTLIRERGVEGAFDPETIRIMVAAFERAWASVQTSGASRSANGHAEWAREIIGKYIIQATQAGDRDEQQLCDGALLELAQSELSVTMPSRPEQSNRPNPESSVIE